MEGNLFKMLFGKLLDALRIEDARARRGQADITSDGLRTSFSTVSDGLRIRGSMFFPAERPSRLYPTLIVCHGIPGAGAARPESDPGYEGLARDFTGLGVAVAIFNFRGCGDSDGDFDMMGWTRDLDAVVNTVSDTPHVDPTRLLVLGFSGGGAAAIEVASHNSRIYGLAVVGTPAHFRIFDKDTDEIIADFKERGIIRNPGFPPDVDKWVAGFEHVEPRRWIAHFKGTSLLIVHGDQDELIPVEHAHELLERAPAGQAKLSIIPGGVHRLRLDPGCINVLKDWVLDTLGWHSS
jgi:pimeloyl-ACP methyl ester carboxylesterase